MACERCGLIIPAAPYGHYDGDYSCPGCGFDPDNEEHVADADEDADHRRRDDA